MRRLNWAAHLLLGVGLFAPCMTVTPKMGEYTGLARWLGLIKEPETYSIFSGVRAMINGSNPLLGWVVLFFSVVLPLSKLVILRASLAAMSRGHPPPAAQRVASAVSKYSRVDVFVIALLIVASKSFPGGTTIDVRWGAFAFAGAALLSIGVSLGVARATTQADA